MSALRHGRLACLVGVTLLGSVVLSTGLAFGGVVFAAASPPSIAFKAAFVPVAGYPETIVGTGAALQVDYKIAGSGYGGVPGNPSGGAPPLSAIDLSLPEGVTVEPGRFGTCTEALLRNTGPLACSRSSRAGPQGSALAEVTFGSERVPEQATLRPFFAPYGGLLLYVAGSSPVSVEPLWAAMWDSTAQAPYGLQLKVQLPAIATVPGAALVATNAIDFEIGAAIGLGAQTVSYLNLPTTCPRGGFPLKSTLTFGGSYSGEREFGIPSETVTEIYKAPCPANMSAGSPGEAVPGTGGVVTAPSNKTCVSRRHFTIHVLHIDGLVYREVAVEVNGRRVRVFGGRRRSAQVDLRGLPKGRYTVRITVTTSTGRRITGTRAYHTCAPKRLPGGNPRL
jgi:hypothetical protein